MTFEVLQFGIGWLKAGSFAKVALMLISEEVVQVRGVSELPGVSPLLKLEAPSNRPSMLTTEETSQFERFWLKPLFA